MEELETLENSECPECPGPPPEFRLPPPPRPPFLTEGTFCSEAPLAELEDCVAIPMIDASYHTNPSLQSTALIITCAVVLLLMAAIISVVFWKHKRKVQNLLPCKSAAGAAAAGRGRVLPDGQPRPGTGTGGPVLYEDLPEALSHSQLRNHHHANHPGQPTIEVRANPEQRARVPAPHHLDYLDYRDPRAILRVADKPSRAVLGGYRTPRALLAKSQSVPLSIASHSAHLNVAASSVLQNHLLATQNTLITSQQPPIVSCCALPENSRAASSETLIRRLPSVPLATSSSSSSSSSYAPPRASAAVPITPTHRPRLRTPTRRPTPVPSPPLPSRASYGEPPLQRRSSVDSEGYSYIDFKDSDLDSRRNPASGMSPRVSERLLTSSSFPSSSPSSARSNSLDSEGYSYIDPNYRRAPGSARRVVTDGTDEEVCPLCTIQQIQHLLARPEDVYLNLQDT